MTSHDYSRALFDVTMQGRRPSFKGRFRTWRLFVWHMPVNVLGLASLFLQYITRMQGSRLRMVWERRTLFVLAAWLSAGFCPMSTIHIIDWAYCSIWWKVWHVNNGQEFNSKNLQLSFPKLCVDTLNRTLWPASSCTVNTSIIVQPPLALFLEVILLTWPSCIDIHLLHDDYIIIWR